MSGLGLDTANRSQGFEPIPAGTTCVLVMKIKPGAVGIDGLCKRSSKGDSEGLDVEYIVKGGEYDKRKIFAFHLLDGVTSGHAKASEISRSLLRAIYESVHAIDPNDKSPEATSRRASASLADFNGATFTGGAGHRTWWRETGWRQLSRQEHHQQGSAPRRHWISEARPATRGTNRAFNTAGHEHHQWFARVPPTMIAKPGWAQS